MGASITISYLHIVVLSRFLYAVTLVGTSASFSTNQVLRASNYLISYVPIYVYNFPLICICTSLIR